MRDVSLQLIAAIAVTASFAFGQVGNGTITGTVTDPAGAVVAAAPVEATNAETGVVYRATTTNAGSYTITDLPVGTYSVSVTVTGFKTPTGRRPHRIARWRQVPRVERADAIAQARDAIRRLWCLRETPAAFDFAPLRSGRTERERKGR
jgi:hypothetical protein